MKVKRLIEILNLLDPDAEVRVEAKDSNSVTSVSQIMVRDPYNPPAIYVYIGDDLSNIVTEIGGYVEVCYSETKDLDKRRCIQ